MRAIFHGFWMSLIAVLTHADAQPQTSFQFIPAKHADIHYLGRVDSSIQDAVGIIWQASTVSTTLTGQYLAIGFQDLQGQVYFDLRLDDEHHVIKAKNGWIEIPIQANQKHRFELLKRTEANAGRVNFIGIRIADNASTAPPTLQNTNLKYVFYGDSITVGACNEDGEQDQWEDRRTHNSARSYAALTSAAMGAQHHNISVSGIGIITGYEPYPVGQIWNRMHYSPSAPLADLTEWQPDVIFLNYGENDDSFTRSKDQSFPANYTQGYIQLVKEMRKAYPESHIVILRGGMYGGAKSDVLRKAWEKAVTHIEKEDPKVSHYIFQHWASLHPRVSDHEKMAEELVIWLKQQAFSMKALPQT